MGIEDALVIANEDLRSMEARIYAACKIRQNLDDMIQEATRRHTEKRLEIKRLQQMSDGRLAISVSKF